MIILILLQRNDKNLSLFANYKYIRGFEYKYGFLLTKIKPQKMKAVITGATKGIGRAIAIKLAQNGYNLILVARGENDLKVLQDELTPYGNAIFTHAADCSVKEEIYAFLNSVNVTFDDVTVLVNNVGAFLPGSMLDEDDQAFEKQQHLNVNAGYYISKFFGKKMRSAKHGHIFNICSVASKAPVKNGGSYSVTKAAMLSLNHVLRQELAPHNVKVTAFLPGSTKTSSWEGTTIPDEKFVQPEDIAETLFTILNLSKGVNVDEVLITPLDF
jgi:short-subunit dehydrogenase